MTLFESVCHAFGAISTGGYSSDNMGITAWHGSVYVKIVLIVFMFLRASTSALYIRWHGATQRRPTQRRLPRLRRHHHPFMLILFASSIAIRGQVENWQSVTSTPLPDCLHPHPTGFSVSNFENWVPSSWPSHSS